jgi:hypothetical protein
MRLLDPLKRVQELVDERIRLIILEKRRIRPDNQRGASHTTFPASFIKDLENDSRFRKVFENKDAIVFCAGDIPEEGR